VKYDLSYKIDQMARYTYGKEMTLHMVNICTYVDKVSGMVGYMDLDILDRIFDSGLIINVDGSSMDHGVFMQRQ